MLPASSLLYRSGLYNALKTGCRNLFSPAAIGVDKYVDARQKVKSQFQNNEDKFKEKIASFLTPDSESTVFTEDLKHMIHLVENNEKDLELLKMMMSKFVRQNKEMRFGSFVFGPVVMRAYYHFNKPVEALEVFNNLESTGFFDQLVTFQILMDLLFINEMYQEVLNVFEKVQDKQVHGSRFPKNCVVLAFGACYKMNTPESFQVMKKLWLGLQEVGHSPMRRASTFAAALALLQNEPSVALEILSAVKQHSYVTVRNLRLMALAALGRPDDALSTLRTMLNFDVHTDKLLTVSEEVISKLEISVNELKNPQVSAEFQQLVPKLQAAGMVENKTMESQLCSEIAHFLQQDGYTRNQPRFSENRSNFRRYRNNKGLSDMT